MSLNVVLVPQRQSPGGMALSWSAMEGVASYDVFVGTRKMSPEELEAAQLLGGTDDCIVVKVSPGVHAVVDDLSPQGETRYYGVAMVFDDGAVKAARFKAVPDGATAESFQLSALQERKPAQREARARADAPVIEPRPFPSTLPVASAPADEAALETRKRQQAAARAAREGAGAADPGGASAAQPPPPSSIPLDEPLEIRMQGATQTWDGLRLYWEREPRAAAYEVIASDHQIFGDELAEALAGKADFTTAVALPPSATAVIDNVTARESRGWYAVIARFPDGRRAAHRFEVGDAAASGRTAAPFLNPNRTGELRSEVEDMLGQAQEQWARWKTEQDGGARREAKRLVGDALLIWPDHPGAKKLSGEME